VHSRAELHQLCIPQTLETEDLNTSQSGIAHDLEPGDSGKLVGRDSCDCQKNLWLVGGGDAAGELQDVLVSLSNIQID